jgi:hypothetical protein
MVEQLPDMPPGVLAFRASGKITRDEYHDVLMKPIYEALERGDRLDLVFEAAPDFAGLDLGALWEDLQAAGSVGLKHRKAWGRMAMITDQDWIRHGVSAFGWISPGELRVFEPAQRDEAIAWVAADAPA